MEIIRFFLSVAHPLILALYVLIYSLTLQASSEVTTRLAVKESLAKNTTAVLSESGNITTVSPGFSYEKDLRRSQLAFDYTFHAIRYSGLSNEDSEYHDLSLLYSIDHVPQHWTTQITGNVSQVYSSVDGVQSFSNELSSGNTKELRTYSVSTGINKIIKQALNFQTQMFVDFADYKDFDNTDSIGFKLALDNDASHQKLFWSSALSSRQTNQSVDSEVQNILQFGLNYRFDARMTGYVKVQENDTSNVVLNDMMTQIGFTWRPGRFSSINAGTVIRGGDTSYILNTSLKKKRFTLSVNYNEEITSARSDIFQKNTEEEVAVTTFKSLSITPILKKKADINLNFSGRRSEATLSFSSQTRTTLNIGADEEKLKVFGLIVSRKLSQKSSLAFRYQLKESQAVEQNDVEGLKLSYNRLISKDINLTAELSNSSQRSNHAANEYEQKLFGVTCEILF